jgi:hypothetical protein
MIPFGVFLYPRWPVWTPATRGRMDEIAMKAKRYWSNLTDVKHFRASKPQLNILLRRSVVEITFARITR